MNERESFEKKDGGIETSLFLNNELYAEAEFLAYKYSMDTKDVFQSFIKLGLKFNRVLDDPHCDIFLLDEEGEPIPLIFMPTFIKKEKGPSNFDLVEARLNLSKGERRQIKRIAKKNNLLTGQVFDNFVEFGLVLTDMMENSTFEDFEIVICDRKQQENSLLFIPTRSKNLK